MGDKANAERNAIEEKARKEKADAAAKYAKIELEFEKKKYNEQLAEQLKIDTERKAKKEAEQLAKAPDKQKLEAWLSKFTMEQMPIFTDEASQKIALEITLKFSGFKKWAKTEISNI